MNATRDWLTKNGLEGFIQVADAPPHEEPEKVASMIELDEISKGIVRALIGLPVRGMCSIKNPSTEILTKYFGQYFIASKAY